MDPQALINHLAREGYWRHIQAACTEALRKRAGDPVLLFWRAFGSLQEGSFSEALRELEPLQGQRDVELAATAASLHAHSHSSLIDEEAVSALKQQLGAAERSAGEAALRQAALFHFHLGPAENLRKANSYLDQVLRSRPQSSEAKCLKAWIELSAADKGGGKSGSYGGRSSGADKALALFEEVLGGNERDLEAMLGQVKCWEVKKEYNKALEHINQVIVVHSWFVPGLSEKAKLLVAIGDWEQAMEVAQRILTVDPANIDALRLSALYLLSQESRPQMALRHLTDLLDSIDRTEPRNAAIYFESAQPLARLAGKSSAAVIQKTLTLVDRACKLAPGDARYIAECGYQQLLSGNAAEALRTYRRASQLDEMNMDAVYGSLFCQIALGQLQEAASHLEFLSEMSTSTDPSPPLLFLSAAVARLKDRNSARACALLDQAVDAHLRALRRLRPGLGFYAALEPDRLLDAAREFLAQAGTEPRGPAEPASPFVGSAVKVLDVLQKAAPGLPDVQLLLGRAKYVDADFEGAQRAVAAALRLEAASAEANVLQSQVRSTRI